MKRMRAQTRDLVGRTIVGVEWRHMRTGPQHNNGWTSDPTIVLDNGARLFFTVDETDGESYGITVGILRPEQRSTR